VLANCAANDKRSLYYIQISLLTFVCIHINPPWLNKFKIEKIEIEQSCEV
jgi:hypothetical protein